MSYFAHKLSIFAATLSLATITNIVFVNQAQAISSGDVPEVINYTPIYQLDIPDSSAFGVSGIQQFSL